MTGIVLQEGAGMPDNIKEGDRVIVDPIFIVVTAAALTLSAELIVVKI